MKKDRSASNSFALCNEEPDRRILMRPESVPFEPRRWKDNNLVETTGGYAYALNLPEIGESMPGALDSWETGLVSLDDYNVKSLRRLLRMDGLLDLHSSQVPPTNDHVIAVAMGEKVFSGLPGLLFMRRDDNEFWSLKPISNKRGCSGASWPVQVDCKGRPIDNPVKADLGRYDQFVGYFCIPNDGILYRAVQEVGNFHDKSPEDSTRICLESRRTFNLGE